MPFEQAQTLRRPEHERGGAERIGHHRTGRDDGDARDGAWRRIESGIDDVPRAFVVAGRADSRVGDPQRVENRPIRARMANADGPGFAVGIASAEIEIAARIDREVAERQSPEVDYVSGATQSTNAFYYAVVEALSKAK